MQYAQTCQVYTPRLWIVKIIHKQNAPMCILTAQQTVLFSIYLHVYEYLRAPYKFAILIRTTNLNANELD